MRKWLIIGLLLLLLLAFVAWQIPSGWALKAAQSANPDLSWSSSTGSAWRGSAENVHWRGLALGTVEWRMLSVEEWTGLQTVWAIRGESPQYAITGKVSVSDGELSRISGLRGNFPAAWIDIGQAVPFVYLAGKLEMDIDEVAFRDGLPASGNGTIRWSDAGLSGLVSESLGSLDFNMAPPMDGAGDVLLFDFASREPADIRVSGSGRLMGNRYETSVRLSIASERADVLELIGPFGQVGQDGNIDFQWRGALFPETE